MASKETETGVPKSNKGADVEAAKKGADRSQSDRETVEGEADSLELSDAELRHIAGGKLPPDPDGN